MAVTLNKANLVLKDANGNIGKIEQLSDRDLAKIRTAVSDVALVVNQSNHTPIKATANTLGVVKPDGSTITINSNGVLTAINANHATNADHATSADTANRAYPRMVGGGDINFYWEGRDGQPKWLWGGEDGSNMYVYNPAALSVNHATSADSATNATNATNADKLDGLHASASVGANTVVARDVNGYVNFNYINSDTSNNENPPISQIIVTSGSDNYYRKASLAHLKNSMGIATEVVPTGAVIFVAMDSTPSGYLPCNGGAVSRTTYSALFAKIGTKYGGGDGSTTFNLPNLIDRFIQGSATVGTYKSAGLPNITGRLIPLALNENGSGGYPLECELDGAFSEAYNNYNNVFRTSSLEYIPNRSIGGMLNASRSSSIYGNSTTVQPPALTLLPCIKY